jgi:hypothetical protein
VHHSSAPAEPPTPTPETGCVWLPVTPLQVLSWMEQCAYISASRLRGAHHLTASMDGVSFAASTKVGDILYIISEVSVWCELGLRGWFSRPSCWDEHCSRWARGRRTLSNVAAFYAVRL